MKEFGCVTYWDKIFEIGSVFKLFELPIVASAFVFTLNFYLYRLFTAENSTTAWKIFTGTIDDRSGAILERPFFVRNTYLTFFLKDSNYNLHYEHQNIMRISQVVLMIWRSPRWSVRCCIWHILAVTTAGACVMVLLTPFALWWEIDMVRFFDHYFEIADGG